MTDHLTSIIPLITGLVLVIFGMVYENIPVMAFGAVSILYGLAIHGNTVRIIRRLEARQRIEASILSLQN